MTSINRKATHMDLVWFLDQRRTGQLNLDPPYQRRSVWSKKDRLFFLDTIFRDFPSPPVFLHKTVSDEGQATYHVVDGKQRLETVFLFTDDKLRMSEEFGDVRFDGKKWSELAPDDKRMLWNYTVPIEYVEVADSTLVNQIFDRLNRNVRKLNPQELRHARFSGWFARRVEEESKRVEWRDLGLVTAARERRMADAQFMSELLAICLRREIHGFDHDQMDKIYADLDGFDQEPDPPVGYPSLDEFEHEYSAKLDLLRAIARSNNGVATHLKTFTNLYTLCGILATTTPDMYDAIIVNTLAFATGVAKSGLDKTAGWPLHPARN